MASQDLKLNHIVLDDDDDDEIVIQAGIPASPARAVTVPSDASDEDAAIDDEPEQDFAYEAPVEEPAPKRAPARSEQQEQTSEDLDLAPMPFAQKATLIGAALLIAAAVAYYFLIMN